MWTTRRLREMEQATIADRRAPRRRERCVPSASDPSSKPAARSARRSTARSAAEQREALETITGPGGVSVLVGRAGTGKGVVISAAARAWQLEGYEVIGTAVAGATAQRLKEDASLDRSFTADGLCNGVEKGRIELGPKTRRDHGRGGDGRHRAPLAAHEAHRRAPQPSSCSPATPRSSARSAPAASSSSCEGRVPTAELTEVHRANHEWERRAWEQVRNGEPGPALASYQAHDRLHIHDTRARPRRRWSTNWDEARRRPARRQGGDDHRRLQRRARPDQRDGPGAPRRKRASSARAGSSCPASPTACAPATR